MIRSLAIWTVVAAVTTVGCNRQSALNPAVTPAPPAATGHRSNSTPAEIETIYYVERLHGAADPEYIDFVCSIDKLVPLAGRDNCIVVIWPADGRLKRIRAWHLGDIRKSEDEFRFELTLASGSFAPDLFVDGLNQICLIPGSTNARIVVVGDQLQYPLDAEAEAKLHQKALARTIDLISYDDPGDEVDHLQRCASGYLMLIHAGSARYSSPASK